MSTMTDNFQAELAEALKRFQMVPEQEAPVIPDAIAAQARELDSLRDVLKIMKKREDALRTSLLEFMATEDAKSLSDGEVAINVTTQMRNGVDRKRMEALYPKVLADCETETLVTQLRVTVTG